MKTEKEIKEKYRPFSGDKLTKHYRSTFGPAPMTEWAMHKDYGWKAALEWVLDKEANEEKQ